MLRKFLVIWRFFFFGVNKLIHLSLDVFFPKLTFLYHINSVPSLFHFFLFWLFQFLKMSKTVVFSAPWFCLLEDSSYTPLFFSSSFCCFSLCFRSKNSFIASKNNLREKLIKAVDLPQRWSIHWMFLFNKTVSWILWLGFK